MQQRGTMQQDMDRRTRDRDMDRWTTSSGRATRTATTCAIKDKLLKQDQDSLKAQESLTREGARAGRGVGRLQVQEQAGLKEQAGG